VQVPVLPLERSSTALDPIEDEAAMQNESFSNSSTPAAHTATPSAEFDPLPSASDPPVLRTEYFVLSAAACTAMSQAPRTAAMLADASSVMLAGASGSLRVTPGTDGMVHVQLVLQSVPQWPAASGPFSVIHLEADLRGSWVERVSDGAKTTHDCAQRLATAVVELAQLPSQTTVAVRLEPETDASAGYAIAA
jgi:hypothetical protein